MLSEEMASKDKVIALYEAGKDEPDEEKTGTKADKVGFMAAADKANLEKKMLADSLASEVVKSLKTFLTTQLKPLQSLTGMVDTINDNIVKAAKDVKVHADTVTAVIETLHESEMEDIGKMKDALAGVGITSEGTKHNIPDTLAALAANGPLLPQQSAPKHPGNCTYQASGVQGNSLICTLGCGSRVQLGVPAKPDQNLGAQVGTTHAQYPPPNLDQSVMYGSTSNFAQRHQNTTQRLTPQYNKAQQNNNGYNNNSKKRNHQTSYGNGQNSYGNGQNNYGNGHNNYGNGQDNYGNGNIRIQNKKAREMSLQYENVQYQAAPNVQYNGYQQHAVVDRPVHAQDQHGNVTFGHPQ